jgi:ABC-2 type transport system permease protein
VANLVYLPLSFASGVFMPLRQLPGFVQQVAPYLPTYHHAQLGWSALRPGEAAPVASLVWLLGYTLVFGALALWAYQREEQRKFV